MDQSSTSTELGEACFRHPSSPVEGAARALSMSLPGMQKAAVVVICVASEFWDYIRARPQS